MTPDEDSAGKQDFKMHVLVTGGAGYLGSITIERLLRCGFRVRAVDILTHGGAPLLSLFGPGFSFINGDIREAAVVNKSLDGIDAVVHLAAIVGDPACARQPDLARQTNYDAAIQMYELARKNGVQQMIFASTCSNYGRMADPNSFVDEDSTLAPVSLYAETKVAVEKKLLSQESHDTPIVTVLRFATLFGLSPRMRFDLTVNEFAMELMTKRKLVVFGEQFWRPYVHVRDAAHAICMVLNDKTGKVAGRVFNVGDSTQNYQKKTIVELVRARVSGGVDIQSIHKQEDPRDYRVSFRRIQQELGFKITATVNDGIREIVDAIAMGVFSDLNESRYRN
jgi:nucleoside-diphosphate-sugar epimerase